MRRNAALEHGMSRLREDFPLCNRLFYLSLYFKQHRAVYYDLLDHVRTHGKADSV